MISRITGLLAAKDLDRVEVTTAGGVTYELAVPLSVFETLPKLGESVTLVTHLVVREDEWQLFGFTVPGERRLFRRLLGATGVGPSLALGMLSTLSAERLVRAIRDRDVATLQTVPRVGRKKAEQLILDLADKLDGVLGEPGDAPRAGGAGAEDAVRALVSLGYNSADADKAVRTVLDASGPMSNAAELIRAALAKLSKR